MNRDAVDDSTVITECPIKRKIEIKTVS